MRPAGTLQAGAPFVAAAAASQGSQQRIAAVPAVEDEHGTEADQPAPQMPAEPQQQQQQQPQQSLQQQPSQSLQRRQPTLAIASPASTLLEFAQPLAATPGAPAELLDVLRTAAAGWLSTEQVHNLLVHAEGYGLPIASKPPWLPAGKLAWADESFVGPESEQLVLTSAILKPFSGAVCSWVAVPAGCFKEAAFEARRLHLDRPALRRIQG